MLVLVTENQLDEWVRSNARDAQGVIVELIWRLVAASCPKPRERRFPVADSIGQHGPDGILDTAVGFEPFIPEGRSLWEVGTGLRARDKATSDYKDLTDAVPDSTRRDSNFIFVTPLSGRRDWEYTWKEEAQATWLEERRNQKEWKDVRLIDGTKLIDWVHQFPPVELWLAQRIIDLPAQQIETLEQRWRVLRSMGERPLTPALFLANRTDASAKLKEVFDGTSVLLKLTSHYPEHVADFVAGYLASLDDENRIDAAGRCLIVSSIDAWNTLCARYQGRNFILVADPRLDLSGDTGAKLIQQARAAGHAVIFGGPHGGIPARDRSSLPLPNPSSDQVQEALEKGGYSGERSRTLAQGSGGNLSSLLRLLQGVSITPEWAVWTEAADLAVAAVVGAWSDQSKADRKVIEALSGKPYGVWIEPMRAIALRQGTPLIQRDGNWKFMPRYEGWYALGARLFDDHLARLKEVAVSALRERDPQFELPKEERYAAQIYGKVLTHSRRLRTGLAEALALLGSHPKALPSCSLGKAETTALLAVREILKDADWVLWASLDDLLPLLAEAAPGEFLDAVEEALRSDLCPFDELFAQEGDGTFGRNYMTGLLWALETLAWDADHLSHVMVCLGELAARDPGGRWANRPANSMTTILLSWLPQTCASIPKRIAAVKVLLTEFPDIGWKLLLSLLPQFHATSTYTHRPAWRATIPDDWSEGVTPIEYWEQVLAYAELAINEAKQESSKLTELVAHLNELPPPARDQVLEYLGSDSVIARAESERLPLWNTLVDLVTKHRKFADARWAMDRELVDRIAALADRLAPSRPVYRHQRLFINRDFDLYEEKGDFEEQRKKLEERRQAAVKDVYLNEGMEGVIAFARAVKSPWNVGIAIGAAESAEADHAIVPDLLESDEEALVNFAAGFVSSRFRSRGWEWVDTIDTSRWTPAQIGRFLTCLPFTAATWERVERLLGDDQAPYWRQANANPYEANAELEFAIDSLIEHGRPYAAIQCVHYMLHTGQPFDPRRAVRALLEALQSSESPHAMDAYEIVDLIKALQNDRNTNPEDLFRVEWAYLSLLEEDHDAAPKSLSRRLADDPQFFCEVIRLVFRSEREDSPAEQVSEERRDMAAHAYRLLRRWRIPPGLREDRSYDGSALTVWLDAVKKKCSETGHFKIALTMIGHVLIYVPADPDGLWIHCAAAAVLNARDAEEMRNGFRTALYNSRGGHWVDRTGREERELAAQFRTQAEAVEGAGYHRLATTLRELAETYEREAEKVSSRTPYDDMA